MNPYYLSTLLGISSICTSPALILLASVKPVPKFYCWVTVLHATLPNISLHRWPSHNELHSIIAGEAAVEDRFPAQQSRILVDTYPHMFRLDSQKHCSKSVLCGIMLSGVSVYTKAIQNEDGQWDPVLQNLVKIIKGVANMM